MKEDRFSFKNDLKDSKISSSSSSLNSSNRNSIKVLKMHKAGEKFNETKRLKYFEIYNQLKEEYMKKSNVDTRKGNKKIKHKKNDLLDDLYTKNTNQINLFYEKNYPNIEIQGTKDLQGINKKDLSSEVKNNQNIFFENMPLKYRNPVLNKNCKKVNYTPIPYMSTSEKNLMNDYEKKQLDKTIEKAIFIRKVEYTHANPPPNSIGYKYKNKKALLLDELKLIKNARIIQNWYRFIKKNKIMRNKALKSNLNNKNQNKEKINKNFNDINKLNYMDNNYKNKLNNINNIKLSQKEKEKNNFIKKNDISFEIITNSNDSYENLYNLFSQLKPINNCCYISKSEMVLINNSKDMHKLNIIQKNVKNFIKNKNQISPYKLYKQINLRANSNKKSIKNDNDNNYNNNQSENSNYLINNSEKIYEKKRILSGFDSLQSIHNNLSLNNDMLYQNNISSEQNEFNDINNSSFNNNNEKNRLSDDNDSDSNLMNFSFNNEINNTSAEEKKEIKAKKEKIIIIQKNKFNDKFFITKINYTNISDINDKLKNIQMNIKTFLLKTKYGNNNNNSIYKENSSDFDYNYNTLNSQNNNPENYEIITEHNFYFYPQEEKDKTRILKNLLKKYNKKINKEVNNNINLYYNKDNERNKILKISKNKLVLILKKIINNKLKNVFNDIYQFETIDYKRKKCLIKIFNNINSKLRRYFYLWSNRPLKLLIYKSKNMKYYHSLNILNKNIKKMIETIYKIFMGDYFYILIIYYLYMNNIDIMNNKFLFFLKNRKNSNLFIKIANIINKKKKEGDNNKMKIIDYFKSMDNMNSSEKIDKENSEEEDD